VKYLRALLGGKIFNNPKDHVELARLFRYVMGADMHGLVLDFFGGSGTTGQAVLELNKEDGGNRKFLLVQLPEPTGRKDFTTIAEITKERVRRVIAGMEKDDAGKLALADGPRPDLGFKVFKLAPSNFAIWDPALAAANPGGLAEQWQLTADNVRVDVQEQALLHELMLKCGLPLSSPIQTTTVASMTVYLLDEGRRLICLVRELTREALRDMINLKPQSLLCLDIGFKGNDALKVNAQLEFQSHDIQFRTA
jgi:adenine-specific DNA-methyltransferase